SRGRRRIAVLTNPGGARPYNSEFLPVALAQRGMSTRPYWIVPLSHAAPEGARVVTQLLMRGGPDSTPDAPDRPDGLIVHNDHLVEEATAGLLVTGVRVPQDLDVVAYSNFPWPAPSHVPVKRLGFSIRDVLRTGIDMIERQRRGEATPRQVHLR